MQLLPIQNEQRKDNPLPQVNYKHEKRQRELEKKKKKEQKIRSKLIKKPAQPKETPEQTPEKWDFASKPGYQERLFSRSYYFGRNINILKKPCGAEFRILLYQVINSMSIYEEYRYA